MQLKPAAVCGVEPRRPDWLDPHLDMLAFAQFAGRPNARNQRPTASLQRGQQEAALVLQPGNIGRQTQEASRAMIDFRGDLAR